MKKEKNAMWRKIFRRFLFSVIFAFVVIDLLIYLFGLRFYFSTGISMEPTIPCYALVVGRSPRDIQIGDIAVFKNYASKGLRLITHRIVAKEGERFVTKGDGNAKPDKYSVAEEDIKAICLFWITF